jgi:predicted RNA-binding protein (TIGR00451 family)
MLPSVSLKPATTLQLRKLRGVASYQLGKVAGTALFDKGIKLVCSRQTGRIRHIYRRNRLIATLRPKDGCLALTLDGAKQLMSRLSRLPNQVAVSDEVSDFIRVGGDVFAKHVVRADQGLRPAEEAIVTDEHGALLGVGRAVLSGYDMRFLKRGVAVRIRRGVDEV